jgi:hypothetical protein
MSNKLITDAFPKVKKQRFIKQKPQSTIKKDRETEVKGLSSFGRLPSLELLFAITDHINRICLLDVDVPIQDEKAKHLLLLKEFDLNFEYGPCIG